MTTVCHGIAKEYQKNFGVSAGVVYNAPKYQPISPIKSQEDKIRLVHHGVALESRCIELMIEMVSYLDDRFTLDFYLVDFTDREEHACYTPTSCSLSRGFLNLSVVNFHLGNQISGSNCGFCSRWGN